MNNHKYKLKIYMTNNTNNNQNNENHLNCNNNIKFSKQFMISKNII